MPIILHLIDGHLPNSVATAAAEYPTAASRHARTAYARALPSTKASTAFLVALLARVDGECMRLDGTALKSTGCLPALAARVATGPRRAPRWTLRALCTSSCAPLLGNGLELRNRQECHTLLRFSQLPRAQCARHERQVTDRTLTQALTVSHPSEQQAEVVIWHGARRRTPPR